MYGRGTSDDGFAPLSILLALKCAIEQGADIPRIVLVLETEEESLSANAKHLLEQNASVIGTPDLCVICDTGNLSHDNLSLTSSVRGSIVFYLKVETTSLGCHQGWGGGMVPDSWDIIISLLN